MSYGVFILSRHRKGCLDCKYTKIGRNGKEEEEVESPKMPHMIHPRVSLRCLLKMFA